VRLKFFAGVNSAKCVEQRFPALPGQAWLAVTVKGWPYSSFHRLVKIGIYPLNWAGLDLGLLPVSPRFRREPIQPPKPIFGMRRQTKSADFAPRNRWNKV